MELDHIAIGASDLEAGTHWIESLFGVSFEQGGQHARFGTHNTLLGMGDLYLEVIARAPGVQAQAPRWFGLDTFQGPPRVINWICRTRDLDAALERAPEAAGRKIEMQRGDLNWQIAVPDDGSLPEGGAYPTLIEWGPRGHPCGRLADSPVRLRALEVIHPAPETLGVGAMDPRVHLLDGPEPRLLATFDTPRGVITL